MNMSSDRITPGQYFWMVAVSVVAGGIYFWPQYLVSVAGTEGLYSLVTVLAVAVGLTSLEAAAMKHADAKTYATGLARIVPWLGLFLLCPFRSVVAIVLDGLILLLYALMMQAFYYPYTPYAVFQVAILLTAGWIGARNLAAVARFSQFWFPIVIALFVLATTFTLPHIRYLAAILPPAHLSIAPWVESVLGTWYLSSNANVVATMANRVDWVGPRQSLWVTMAAIASQGLVILTLYAMTLWTLGPDAVARLYWPLGEFS